MTNRLIASALALGFVAAPAAMAQGNDVEAVAEQTPIEMRAEQVVLLLNGQLDEQPDAVFTEAFLAAVPTEQLKAISQQLTGQFGAAISVEAVEPRDGNRASLAIRLERAIARGGIAIDPASGNRISELLFQSFEPISESPEEIRAALEDLPGAANALFARITREGAVQPVFAHNEDTQLALGSAFKLYVLSALANSVEQGERSWADVVSLTEKSFPSGQMQNWPQGAPVTLQTLATMMISISDNTATDQLITTLGRQAVEAELVASGNSDPSATIPLMTTRQLFAMRGVSEETIARYRAADDAGQRAILDGLTEADVSQEKVQAAFGSDTPGAIDIEWFASPNDLARLLARLNAYENPAARQVMAVAPQLTGAQGDAWDYVGFKGGSEPGVLNFTWLLRDGNGDAWIATVGWNNPEAGVETTTLYAIAQRMLALPR
ncbi:serine hydrolase [Erythrobacter sp. GH1-10]|uniref:serine hydrolase n=1 Tax=Erythrobacter sp. GH1-10 TaxID=3349334 RepID=UPI003877D592